MARVLLTLPDTITTVSHYVERCAVESIMRATGFPVDAEVVYKAEDDTTRRKESLDSNNTHIRTRHTDKVTVTGTEKIREEFVMPRLKTMGFNKPLLEDKALGLYVAGVYMPMDCTLELTFQFQSKASMDSWVRRISIKEKMGPIVFDIELLYNYAFPKDLTRFIKHTHDLREGQEGYGDTYEDYIKSITKTNTVKRSNRSGQVSIDVMNELQSGIPAHLVSEFIFNEKQADKGVYEVTGTIQFDYNQITAFSVDFPFIIHNQMIDETFLNLWLKKKIIETKGIKDDGMIIGEARQNGNRVYRGDGGKRLMDFDPWFPEEVYPNNSTLFITPIRVSPSDRKDVIGLNDIDDSLLPLQVKRYIAKYPEQVSDWIDGPYHIEIYKLSSEGEIVCSFTIDSGLNIRTVFDMDLRTRYYLRVSALSDMSLIGNHIVKQFLKTKEDTLDAMYHVAPNLEVIDKYEAGKLHQLRDGSITDRSYSSVLHTLSSTSKEFKSIKNRLRPSVSKSTVIARRR